jgi:hypothetical protein
VAITADRNVVQKEAEKKLKYKSLGIEITTNLEPEMYDTSNIWSHWDSKEKLQEKFGSCNRKTFDRFTTKDSYAWNNTHNTKVLQWGNWKPERWETPLVQRKYQEEKAVDKSR